MLSKRTIILIISGLLFYNIGVPLCGQVPKCLAVITEISGDVLVKKANKTDFEKASWGTQLFQGDQIKTSDRSQVSLLFANSSLIKLAANSRMTVSVTGTTANVKATEIPTNISAAMVGNFFTVTSKRENKEERGALAGLRSVSEDLVIRPASPFNTLIKTIRPSFTWNTIKSFDSFKVNLFNSRGLVWSRKVTDSTMKYPDNDNGLDYGETYFWNVEGEGLIENVKSANHKFSVLSSEKSKEVEGQETIIRNTFKDASESSSLHSVLGAYYINQGLLQDAINEFQIISKINADATLPHEILGSIYSDMGNKDKAIEELQKALTLAKNKDK